MNIYLILYNIRSLYNVGSAFRTADAFGVSKIYLCGYTGAPTDRLGRPVREVAKTALGAERTVPWEKAWQTWRLIERLKNEGVFVVALENNVSEAVPINKIKFSFLRGRAGRDAALVLGNEVTGLSKSILKRADAIAEIPMHGKKESLNVAIACGIGLYALTNPSRSPWGGLSAKEG